MKVQTNLKAGAMPGKCHKVVNRYGKCKYISCPYPPFKFRCKKGGLLPQEGGIVEGPILPEGMEDLAEVVED